MTWFCMSRSCPTVHRPTDQCSDFEQAILLICSSQFLLAMLMIPLASGSVQIAAIRDGQPSNRLVFSSENTYTIIRILSS